MIRKIALIVCVSLVLFVFVSFAGTATYSVGQSVEVQWKNAWYPAEVLKVESGKYYIHYDGYGSSWDEWVTTARMRTTGNAATYQVGDAVKVEWKGSWYAAKVMKVNGDQYYIHYDGYGSEWDEWVGTSRIKSR